MYGDMTQGMVLQVHVQECNVTQVYSIQVQE